ncbi:MAG: MBL fold metallo-hydrolase [Micropruina sp.]|nr:MAG: MBL fold metallo-hydrolase [Micropruina sp.]
MKSLGDNAFHLATAIAANAYLVEGRRGLILIDPGLAPNVNRIARELVHHGLSPFHVTDILLTHYDPDHAGSADTWAHRTGARVWIGAADAAILRGEAKPPRTPFRRTMALAGRPKLPHNTTLIEDDTEVVDGIRAVPTPGHTPGHVAFVHRGVGFIGDAARVSPEATLHPGPEFLDTDPVQAAASRALLQTLGIVTICAGHSAPAMRI